MPRSPAITSALIVLPVPESPAKSAVIPVPRPPPGRICHSPSTRSRWRARSVRLRRELPTVGASTRSSQETRASMRRARCSRPAAFCWRAPRRTSSTVTSRPDTRAIVAAASAARRICGAPRRYWPTARSGSTAPPWSAEGGRPEPGPGADLHPRRLDDERGARGPGRVPRAMAEQHEPPGHRGEALQRGRARRGQLVDRSGHEHPAGEAGLAHRGRADAVRVGAPDELAQVDEHAARRRRRRPRRR